MIKLLEKIKKYNLEDAIEFEQKDRQFLALLEFWKNLEKIKNISKEQKIYFYLSLIISNSIVCYQLSGKWEDYWEEFSLYFSCEKNLKWKDKNNIINFLTEFLKTCKYNKRFTEIKIKRLKKLETFLQKFNWKEKYFYENMIFLRDSLAETMKQKKEDKTIVFAVKMFSYGARNIFDFVVFPREIFIPIDSRLINLFEKYKWNYTDIKNFYIDLSKKLDISLMHLDGIIWTMYDELIGK